MSRMKAACGALRGYKHPITPGVAWRCRRSPLCPLSSCSPQLPALNRRQLLLSSMMYSATVAGAMQEESNNIVSISQQLASSAPKLPWPPHPPLAGSEPGSFAEDTITKRLPAILASTIKDLEAVAARHADEPDKQAQVKSLISGVSALREEILQGGAVTPPDVPAGDHVPAAVNAAVTATQQAISLWKRHTPEPHTWLTLPWLLVECVMYVRLAVETAKQPLLAASKFDMFSEAKAAGWQKCVGAAADLAVSYTRLSDTLAAAGGVSGSKGYHAAWKLALAEVIQFSLWGNKTDLSLLVDASALNPVAAVTQTNSSSTEEGDLLQLANPHIIVDNFQAVAHHLEAVNHKHGPGRVDIILDNSGLELYSDLLLADFLLTHGLASKVVLHGKPFPWFVSDTLQSDLDTLLSDCGPSSPTPAGLLDAHGGDQRAADMAWEAVRKLGSRWAEHLASGHWQYTSDAFWVTPLPFCWMKAAAPKLYRDLATSNLLIFKGDLNYRKLVHDCRWPSTTPWTEALQGFCPAPLVTLRTLKADVVGGLQPGQAESLSQQDAQWLVDGKWGMVQFATPQQVTGSKQLDQHGTSV